MFRLVTIFIMAGTLYGCTTAKVYEPPDVGQPAAEVIVPKDSSFGIVLLDQWGCYRGWNGIKTFEAPGMRVPADKEVIFEYFKTIGSKRCRIIFSFKPEAEGRYFFLDRTIREKDTNAGAFSKFWGTDSKEFCAVLVVKKPVEGEGDFVKATQLKMSGLFCLTPK